MNDSLNQLAAEIVHTEAGAAQAETAHAEAQTRQGQIAARLAALAAERVAIVARRAGGDHRPDDGASLALIAADLEILGDLQTEAAAAVQSASAARRQAAAAHGAAKTAFATEQSRLALAALDEHADRLVHLLAETCRQRAAAAAKLPQNQQDLGAVTGRLVALDAVLVGDLQSIARWAPFRDLAYASQPSWRPSDALYDRVWRHHGGDGRFV